MARLAFTHTLDHYPKLTVKQYLTENRGGLRTTTTPCNYGGCRTWFVCECGKRVGVLYWCGVWRCRHCIGANYQSQHNQPIDRLNERVNAIRSKLGWQRGIGNGHGNRPKGMHKRTYHRLMWEYLLLESNFIGAMAERTQADKEKMI